MGSHFASRGLYSKAHFGSSNVGASNIANDGHRPIGFIWMIPGGMAATGPANVEVDSPVAREDEEEEKCQAKLRAARDQIEKCGNVQDYAGAAVIQEKICRTHGLWPHAM